MPRKRDSAQFSKLDAASKAVVETMMAHKLKTGESIAVLANCMAWGAHIENIPADALHEIIDHYLLYFRQQHPKATAEERLS